MTSRGTATESGPAVHTTKRVSWRLASSFPSSLDTIYGAGEVLSERVAAMTEGAFNIRVYQSGELVPGLQVMDAVQKGSAEIGQTASYYYIGKNPALAFDTCLPFGFTPRQQNAWLHEGGGLDFVQELFSDFGIVSFPAGNTGVQMGGWFRDPISTAEDLRGLKMRIPGLGGKVMDRLGVRNTIVTGMLLSAATMVLFGFAPVLLGDGHPDSGDGGNGDVLPETKERKHLHQGKIQHGSILPTHRPLLNI
jgi:TRAP-type mannitol/chloroaromatic compound transport system substrate-binding protein